MDRIHQRHSNRGQIASVAFVLLTSFVFSTAFVSCDDKRAQQTSNDVRNDSNLVEMEEPEDTLITKLYTREQKDSTGDYSITVEWPEADDDDMQPAASIREWANEILGGTYYDDMEKPQLMVNHYLTEILNEYHDTYKEGEVFLRQNDIKLLNTCRIIKDFEAEKFVTFIYHAESYLGGAHGGVSNFGQTFRKDDGRRIGWEIFKAGTSEDMQETIRQGLYDYFSSDGEEIKTPQQLSEMLLIDNAEYFIPLPQCQPLFLKDGILFIYNQYEIAPYAAGMPQFIVSYKQAKKLMNVTGQRLL